MNTNCTLFQNILKNHIFNGRLFSPLDSQRGQRQAQPSAAVRARQHQNQPEKIHRLPGEGGEEVKPVGASHDEPSSLCGQMSWHEPRVTEYGLQTIDYLLHWWPAHLF